MGNVISSISYYAWLPLSFVFGEDAAANAGTGGPPPEFKTQNAKTLDTMLDHTLNTHRETRQVVPEARCDQLVSLMHKILQDYEKNNNNNHNNNNNNNNDSTAATSTESPTNVAFLLTGVAFLLIAGFDIRGPSSSSSSSTTKQKRCEKSLDLFSTALKIHRQVYGEKDSEEIASSISNVGVALNNLGRSHEATNLLREALDIRKRLYASRDHPDIVASLYSLGMALIAAKDQSGEAATIIRQAISMYSNLPNASRSTLAKWENDLKVAEKL